MDDLERNQRQAEMEAIAHRAAEDLCGMWALFYAFAGFLGFAVLAAAWCLHG